MKAVVVLADGFEEIEAVTAVDVLRRAGIEVVTAGLGDDTIRGSHDINVAADTELTGAIEDAEALVLPGGLPGAENLADSEVVNAMIRSMNEEGKIVAAICASPAYVLAPSGILDGRKATCYPGCEERFGKDTVFDGARVVRDGNVITSRGPGTALEFALEIVEALTGREKSEELGRKMLVA